MRQVARDLRVLAVLSFLSSHALQAVAQQPAFDNEKLADIPRRMEEFVKAGQISGAVTLVATKDRVVHLAAVGKADVASRRPMEPDAIFRVASMTKPITATSLMMLVEQEKLNVDDPVSKYIPAFAGQKLKDGSAARPVTIKDIVTHTAGLATGSGVGGNASLEQIVEGIGKLPLEFPPGSKW